ncbi:MAG: 4Fe-4S dicluster domain-containing protein [Bacteroidetes bacterium]|nr:4Fe-4S dicluster domain-containing protein [Bacteroidota bacterium]
MEAAIAFAVIIDNEMLMKKKDIWTALDEDGNKLIPGKSPIPSTHMRDHIFNFSLLKSDRRNFLKSVGLGSVAFSLATACSKSAVKKGLPFFPNSSDAKPGQELYYKTTCPVCLAHCPLSVKTIDYRPVKIEGNNEYPKTSGGLCASAHASLFDLYNRERITKPYKGPLEKTWKELDIEIRSKLQELSARGKEIAILSDHINSPASLQLLSDFKTEYPATQLYFLNPLFPDALIQANKKCFGKAVIPSFHFSKARLIVSFGADFLASWLNPVEFTQEYLAMRDIDNSRSLSYHIQFESQYSITAASADKRFRIKPSEEGIILRALYDYLQTKSILPPHKPIEEKYEIARLAEKLLEYRGRSIVISSSNDTAIQMLVTGINSLLDNYGRSIDLDNPFLKIPQENGSVNELISKIEKNQIAALVCWNKDLHSDYPVFNDLQDNLEAIELKISFNHYRDRFSEYADYLCPDHHYLEAWNNYVSKGYLKMAQASIKPLFNSRQAEDSLLRWMKHPDDWYAYLIKSTQAFLQGVSKGNEVAMEEVIKKGFWEIPLTKARQYNFKQYLDPYIQQLESEKKGSGVFEILLVESPDLKSYSSKLNPFLAEKPDPVSSSSWKVYVRISPKTAKQNGIKDGQFIRIRTAIAEIKIPCLVQAGVADSCLIIPAGKMAGALMEKNNSLQLFDRRALSHQKSSMQAEIDVLPGKEKICRTQSHHTISVEAIVPEISLREYLDKDPSQKSAEPLSSLLTKKRDFHPHHWGMVIDLNRCTGCGACSVSCQAENNIPVVGEEEVTKGRSMAWMKIQRFYEGETDNPLIRFLPVLCQQCDNAPCESVCPVSAVSSSTEGLNQQNYSRCIGARFCATNCPYLSRTFNYKNYTYENPHSPHMSDKTGRLMLNPEVSTREKGTAEKCTFCIQRIQKRKARAKQANQSLADGMIKTACQQSCPASAIYFGDMKDPSSRVYHLLQSKRAHQVLGRIGTRPSIYYLSKVRNMDMDI